MLLNFYWALHSLASAFKGVLCYYFYMGLLGFEDTEVESLLSLAFENIFLLKLETLESRSSALLLLVLD